MNERSNEGMHQKKRSIEHTLAVPGIIESRFVAELHGHTDTRECRRF